MLKAGSPTSPPQPQAHFLVQRRRGVVGGKGVLSVLVWQKPKSTPSDLNKLKQRSELLRVDRVDVRRVINRWRGTKTGNSWKPFAPKGWRGRGRTEWWEPGRRGGAGGCSVVSPPWSHSSSQRCWFSFLGTEQSGGTWGRGFQFLDFCAEQTKKLLLPPCWSYFC